MIKPNFMLAVLGIVVLGGWVLQTCLSATAILPVSSLAPVIADTNQRPVPVLVVPAPQRTTFKCASCGVVVSMRLVTATDAAAAKNLVGRAVVGGMIGNLLGGARSQELFGWLGAIAAIRNGGVLQPGMRYETTVRFDNGASRVFVNMTRPRWRDGDRVRIVEGTIQAFSPEGAQMKAAVTLSHLFPVAPVWI